MTPECSKRDIQLGEYGAVLLETFGDSGLRLHLDRLAQIAFSLFERERRRGYEIDPSSLTDFDKNREKGP
jgi:hypothetical protein